MASRDGFCFSGGLSISRQRLVSKELETGQLLKLLGWTTPTFSSVAMQTRFSNIFKAAKILTHIIYIRFSVDLQYTVWHTVSYQAI